MVATKWLRLAMNTDEERKTRLEKMVATTQFRLAMETEEYRRARLEHLSANQHLRLSAETNNKRAARLEHLSANQHLRLAGCWDRWRERSKNATCGCSHAAKMWLRWATPTPRTASCSSCHAFISRWHVFSLDTHLLHLHGNIFCDANQFHVCRRLNVNCTDLCISWAK